MINFEYFNANAATAEAGVFIPQSNLPGVSASELAAGVSDKQSKFILGFFRAIYNKFVTLNVQPLGLTFDQSSPSAAGINLINESYSLTHTFLANHELNTVSQVPVGAGGTVIEIEDIFPGATKMAAAASTGGAGVLIPTSELTPYGSPAQADINVAADSRRWFAALSLYLSQNLALRTETTASAILATSAGTNVTFFPPESWTATTNPVSGVLAANLPKLSFFTRTFDFTIQLRYDHNSQTFDVNSVIA